MQPNTWKYFPFPKISISRKYVFSEKRFTATKHSLSDPIQDDVVHYIEQNITEPFQIHRTTKQASNL